MNKNIFLSLIICTVTFVITASEQPFILQNGLVDNVNLKYYLKFFLERPSPFSYPQLYGIYILIRKNNMPDLIEPVNENNIKIAFKFIDENNGIVCPNNSEMNKIISTISRFSSHPYPSMKSIILGTTDCSKCDEFFSKYYQEQ